MYFYALRYGIFVRETRDQGQMCCCTSELLCFKVIEFYSLKFIQNSETIKLTQEIENVSYSLFKANNNLNYIYLDDYGTYMNINTWLRSSFSIYIYSASRN